MRVSEGVRHLRVFSQYLPLAILALCGCESVSLTPAQAAQQHQINLALYSCMQQATAMYPNVQPRDQRGPSTTQCNQNGRTISCTTEEGQRKTDFYAAGQNLGNSIARNSVVDNCMSAKGYARR